MSVCPIRLGNDSDAAGVIALIGACWSQYPGVIMDVDGEMPELHALASYYRDAGGAFWVAEADGRIVGMVATRPREAASWEICRVYVDPTAHGGGLGHRLLDRAEQHAISAGAKRLVLWSDTRFERAHRFYEKRSYIRFGPIRVLDDISHSLEFAYAKPVNGVEQLDVAAAASAERRLAAIMVDCVAAGAGGAFLPPLAPEVALGFWHGLLPEVASGARILFGGWRDGVLAGTVTLALATAQNQPHVAAVQQLLVDPAFCRRNLADALMQRLEQAAMRIGRTLLTLDTRAGGVAELPYRDLGWQELGIIPDFVRLADGSAGDTLFLWKRLA